MLTWNDNVIEPCGCISFEKELNLGYPGQSTEYWATAQYALSPSCSKKHPYHPETSFFGAYRTHNPEPHVDPYLCLFEPEEDNHGY